MPVNSVCSPHPLYPFHVRQPRLNNPQRGAQRHSTGGAYVIVVEVQLSHRRLAHRQRLTQRDRAGVAFGWIFSAHMIGGAVAAYGAGYSRTTLQTYLPAFYAAGALCLVAAMLVWLIQRRPAAVAAPVRAAA